MIHQQFNEYTVFVLHEQGNKTGQCDVASYKAQIWRIGSVSCRLCLNPLPLMDFLRLQPSAVPHVNVSAYATEAWG